MTEPNRELTDTSRYVLRYAGPDGRLYENLHAMPRFFADDARGHASPSLAATVHAGH